MTLQARGVEGRGELADAGSLSPVTERRLKKIGDALERRVNDANQRAGRLVSENRHLRQEITDLRMEKVAGYV